MRDLTVTRSHPRTAIRPRRVAWLLAALVVGTLVVPTSVAMAKRSCDATVRGSSADSVHAARDRAGRNGVVCFPGRTYTGILRATVTGQVWRLSSKAKLTDSVIVTASRVKIKGGTISRTTSNMWTASIEVRAHHVTVSRVKFRGGGIGVSIYGKDYAVVERSSFRGLSGSAIGIWGDGVGADHNKIRRNTIVQTVTHQVSPIMSRGNEQHLPGGVQNRGNRIRHNTIDQGQGDRGWFGIELKQSRGTVVEYNKLKGGEVLISLPESNGTVIRHNTLDLRGTAHWGVEVGDSDDTDIERNTFVGDGRSSNDFGVAMNTGPQRMDLRYNKARDLFTLVGISGDHHRITDNCLTRVGVLAEWVTNGGPHITYKRNRTC